MANQLNLSHTYVPIHVSKTYVAKENSYTTLNGYDLYIIYNIYVFINLIVFISLIITRLSGSVFKHLSQINIY